ncbi:MAG: tetratricopeptide repeat protein [Streptosporangiaceae bacterium]|nr:tetratricopeptide repeat protein [Streptosporangiaceae bacterium]
MVKFRLLGPLEVRVGEQWEAIGAPKWRSLLAALLINAGQIVSTETLIDEVWGDDEPAKAANLVSIYVLRLRRLIGDTNSSILITRSPGYLLRVPPEAIDSQLFEKMVREGRRALSNGEAQRAAEQLAEAVALWRGSPLADVPHSQMVEAEADRLTELKLDADELRITAELACGGHAQVVPELRRLLANNQLREGLWLLLMKALDGSGRHAEALDAYGQARKVISNELGVDPGPELRRLYADLLSADSSSASGPPPGSPAGTILAGSVAATTAPPPKPAAPKPAASEAAGPKTAVPDSAEPATTGSARPRQDGLAAELTPSAAAAAQAAEARESSVPVTADRRETQAPAQLPTDIADFTGREEQVQHLSDLLASASDENSGAVRIALVAGYGGLGKTSLAVHAAHRVRGRFPDGQLYVDLLGATPHPLAAADVLARFLRDLGVDGKEIPLDEAERSARYRTSLAGRRVLVVLDNARDAAQVRPLLPGSAACAVLITTRSRMPDLASGELVDLNVLDDDEALTLFTRIVGDKRAAAEPEATAELLLACAGLPLAIRICAARVATRRGWSIRTMADRLRDEHRRLDEMAVGDMAVRASFEVSFAALPTAKRGVNPADAFRLLGLWHGPTISSAAAAALFGVTEDQAVDALELLVDANLLECVATDRYKFHDLLRVYAAERAEADLSEDGRLSAIARLLRWYMRTADGAATAVSPYRYNIPLEPGEVDPMPSGFDGIEDALSWYDSERVNVVAATSQAAAVGLHEVAWRLPASLFSVLNRRGSFADLVATHRIALTSAREVGNRRGEAWVLNNFGNSLARIGKAEGIGYLEQALAISREIGDRIGEARAAHNLAEGHYLVNGPQTALEHMLRSLQVQREVGYSALHAGTLNNLGQIYMELGRLDEAVDCLQDALPIYASSNSAHGTGHVLLNLGRAQLALGHHEEALAHFRRSLVSHRASGDRPNEALTLRFLGQAQLGRGDIAAAGESFTSALMIYDELGDGTHVAEVRSLLSSTGQ